MSDYGAVIGGVVGAVVGFYAGGPVGAQWGWMIGAGLGGAYSASQQVIPGAKIGDVVRQTSQEGGFRPIVYGRSHPIAGNVIADSEPKIVTRRESQGKGGPKVETESAYRTYAVGFCEGDAKLLQAWRNGILVYNAEDPSMGAENAKFLEYATWYTGSFDQPASPDLEEIYGAGQAPFFRGTAYLSIHNEDVTDQRGAWSQWQVRVFRGARARLTTPPYVMESIAGLVAANALTSRVKVDSTVSFIGDTWNDIYVSGVELRDMQVQAGEVAGEFTADCYVVGAAITDARVTKTQVMGEYGADCTVVSIQLEQIRVVLNTTQETKYLANASVVSIEVVVP